MWPKLAFEQTADLAKIVLIYVVIENTVTTASRLHTILLTMVVGGLFPAVGTIKNYLGGILVEGSRGAWQGVFANPNEVAFALVLLVPIAAALASKSGWIMKLALWGVIATYLVAIFFTYSRGGLLALFAVFGLMGWKQKSMLIRAVMVAGLIGALFIGGMYWKRDAGFKDVAQDTTYNQRIATIKAGIRMFEARPLLGVGPGCSVVAYPIYVPPEAHCGCQLQLVIHNTFVQALSEVGILGFGAFMLFLGVSFLHLWKIQKGPLAAYGGALEVALWGFMVCSLSGGFSYTWWPYLLIGLVVATKHIAASLPAEGNNAAAAV
jgi:putative inorganic carbon (HCO3(-)) transporter